MVKKAEAQQSKQWTKIPKKKKSKLIEMVFQQEYKIKHAAEIVGINYATAKHIIYRYRNKNIKKKIPNIPESKRCSFKPISTDKPKCPIRCLQGGKKIVKSKQKQRQ